jgi:hypothetical protein
LVGVDLASNELPNLPELPIRQRERFKNSQGIKFD